ncbi:hypothetical protein [Sulfitobacter mediterraneus]|uniref:hypothetical protein n=1 Tax=Sulfitobacter mediterraneus TaxID=83219 RepID=UPI0013C52DD6|nr:hypothetical protein [Sulfitobacter mediterraneus]
MADFYAARDDTMSPLPWSSIAPPITEYMTKAVAKKVQFHLEKEISETVDNPSVFRKIAWLALQWNEQMQPLNGYPSFDCRTSYRENPIHLETVNW